ncbi:hypothetical protein LXL04_011756 [Taraxacum kok-saghyz]
MMQPVFAAMALLDPLLPDSDLPLQTNTTCGTVSAPLKMRRICATFRGCDEILLLRGFFNTIYRILGEIHIRILARQLGRHLRLDDATGVCSYGVVRSPFTVLSWQKVISVILILHIVLDYTGLQLTFGFDLGCPILLGDDMFSLLRIPLYVVGLILLFSDRLQQVKGFANFFGKDALLIWVLHFIALISLTVGNWREYRNKNILGSHTKRTRQRT